MLSMGFSQRHKRATHDRILEAAGHLFRTEGIEGASVDSVMRAAGSTVGAFYGHFGSKEELVTASLAQLLTGQMESWTEGLGGLEGSAWAGRFLERYLTAENRDTSVCALPAVVPDIARAGEGVRSTFALGLGALIATVEAQLGGAGARTRAVQLVAMAFGALALSKACRGSPLSDELLAQSRPARERPAAGRPRAAPRRRGRR